MQASLADSERLFAQISPQDDDDQSKGSSEQARDEPFSRQQEWEGLGQEGQTDLQREVCDDSGKEPKSHKCHYDPESTYHPLPRFHRILEVSVFMFWAYSLDRVDKSKVSSSQGLHVPSIEPRNLIQQQQYDIAAVSALTSASILGQRKGFLYWRGQRTWYLEMSGLSKRWEAKNETPLSTKLKESVRPPGALKPRLESAVRRIEIQVQKMDQTSNRFSERDRSIFNRVVDAYEKHDMMRAHVFANELAEIRKMEQMILHAKLALEQIVLRLKTVTELGDVAVALAPVIGVVQNIKRAMSTVSPEAEKELTDIGELLSGIVWDAGSITGSSINFDTVNEDSQKILSEAATVAEQRMKTKFPELPTIDEKVGEAIRP